MLVVDCGFCGDVNLYLDLDLLFLSCWILKTGFIFEMGMDGVGLKVKFFGVVIVDEDEVEVCDDDRGMVVSIGWFGVVVILDLVMGLIMRVRDVLFCAIGFGFGM